MEQVRLILFIKNRLADKYSSQLEKFSLVCHFCGCYLDSETMNLQCVSNTGISEYKLKVKFTDDILSSEYYNNKRHYFGKPSEDYNDKMNNTVINTHINQKNNDEKIKREIEQLEIIKAMEREKMESSIIEKEKENKSKNARIKSSNQIQFDNLQSNERFGKNSNLDIDGIYEKIRFFSKQNGINLEKMLEDFFKGRDSTSYDEIKLLLSTKFDLSENECNRFLGQIIMKPPTIGVTNPYDEISQYNFNPNYMSKFNQFSNSPLRNNYHSGYGVNNNENFNNYNDYNYVESKGKYLSNYNQNNSFINEELKNSNQTVKMEELIGLLKRSEDFPKRSNFYNSKEISETIYEKERRLLNNYNNKMKEENKSAKDLQSNSQYTVNTQELILKLLSNIALFNLNFYQMLSEFDLGNGFINKSNLIDVLSKLNIKVNNGDINNFLNYFKIQNIGSINIQELTEKLMKEAVNLQMQV